MKIQGQITYVFIDSISNEPVSGVAINSGDSVIAISNTEGVARIDVKNNNEQLLSAKHSLYHQKEIKANNSTITLSPRYQFLDEFTYESVDYFDLYEMILEKNRLKNEKAYQYVKLDYYKQMVVIDKNSDTSKVKFLGILYVDLTDKKNKIIYIDDYDKTSSIKNDKTEAFYNLFPDFNSIWFSYALKV